MPVVVKNKEACFLIAHRILLQQRQVWFIPLSWVESRYLYAVPNSLFSHNSAVSGWMRGVHVNCEIPWECVPYLSALEVCSWWYAIQIHVYLTLPYLT